MLKIRYSENTPIFLQNLINFQVLSKLQPMGNISVYKFWV